MSNMNEERDIQTARRSERALRALAAGLGVAFLIGVAACGGDDPEVEAAVAMEPVVTRTPPVTEDTSRAQAPDPASTPAPAPVSRIVSYDEAEAAYHGGEYAVAVDLFQAYAGQRPENPWGHYMLGLSAWKAGHLDVAELALTESVTLSPDHVKGRVNLARVLLEAGRHQDALEHARHAEDVDPTSVQARRTLARALGETGDVEGAVDMYESALRLAPEDAWSLNNLGYLLIQQGRYEEAVGPLALATTVESGNPVFLNNLGHALEGSGYRASALRAFLDAEEADERYGKAVESVTRLQSLVPTDGELEIDVAAVAEAYRARLAGAPEEGSVPGHRGPESGGNPDGSRAGPAGESPDR